MKLQEQIRKVLKEYWVKKKQDNTDLEDILNKVMSKKYSWWKKIIIDELSFSELSNVMTIYGTLEVDEEWGSERWGEYRSFLPFPGNSGWEDDNPERLGDIISDEFSDKLSRLLSDLIMSVTQYESIRHTRVSQLKLRFV
jgi:hypothetical protein